MCQESKREFFNEIKSYNKGKQVTELIQFMMDRYYKNPELVQEAYNEKIKDHTHDFQTAKEMFAGTFQFFKLFDLLKI